MSPKHRTRRVPATKRIQKKAHSTTPTRIRRARNARGVTTPSAAPADWVLLKRKAVEEALRYDEHLYETTQNSRHVWHAWQIARKAKTGFPQWVLQYIDRVAASDMSKRDRKADTADRYAAAITDMEAAVDRHSSRLRMRRVAAQLGAEIQISRRDTPNLSAIARVVASAHGVSLNRLLARYRLTHKRER
jgi:hypothetical protein